MSKWREQYNVHPAADVFPMMSDEELAALGEDIEENGLRDPIKLLRTGKEKRAPEYGENAFTQPTVILDGRNRLEAMERAGWDLDGCRVKWEYVNGSRGPFPPDFDAVAYVISANIKRRHLTKQEQADLIVAAIKAGEEYSATLAEKSRGRPKSQLKSKACELAAKADISERTVERSIAKADGKAPKPKREWRDVHDDDGELIGRVPDDTLEPSDEVEDPAQILTNILDSIKHAKSVAEAYRKILKSSSFDREAKEQIYNAIKQLRAKWQAVQSALDAVGGDIDAPKKKTCRKCHGTGTITSKKTGTTVDCDCVRRA
jgi:hypothetical protein